MKKIIITESQYDYILKNGKVLTEAEVKGDTFQFKETFPDNIAFPVKPGVVVKNVNEINFSNMTAELQEFIMKLKLAVKKGAKVDTVKIQSGASTAKPTTSAPKGYDQSLVKLSYMSDGKEVYDNKVIASNRGKSIKSILERLIPELKGKITNPETFIGDKVINVTIPSGIIFNIKNDPKLKKEYKPSSQVYNPKQHAIKVTKCGQPIKASGSAGIATKGFLADQILIDFDPNYSGNIQFVANSYMIPDRFIVRRIKVGTNKSETVVDSGYVTSISNTDQSFNGLQNELKTLLGVELKGGVSNYSYTIKKEAGYNYMINVYAPFGGTLWTANLKCEDQKPQQKQQSQQKQMKLEDGYGKYYINQKTKTLTKDNCGADCDIRMDGDIKDGKLINGKLYVYDDNNLLEKIRIYKNGKDVGSGTLEF